MKGVTIFMSTVIIDVYKMCIMLCWFVLLHHMKSYFCIFTQFIHCILLMSGYLSKPLSMCIQIIYSVCFNNYDNVSIILLMICLRMIICLIHICIVLGSSHSVLFDWLLSLIFYKIYLVHTHMESY